jgi:hypothetical protein
VTSWQIDKAGLKQSKGDGCCHVVRADMPKNSEMKVRYLADIGDLRVER